MKYVKRFYPMLLAILLAMGIFTAAVFTSCTPAAAPSAQVVPAPTPEVPAATAQPSADAADIPGFSQSGGTGGTFEEGIYDYRGTIGDKPVRVSLAFTAKGIKGSYLYEGDRVEVKLSGKAGASEFVLVASDPSGKPVGSWRAPLSAPDKLEGIVTGADGRTAEPFTLALLHILPGAEHGKRYAAVLAEKTSKDVTAFVTALQAAIQNDDREALAQMVCYPITTSIGGERTEIADADALLAQFDQVFSAGLKDAVVSDYAQYLFVNSGGIMVGEGMHNLWINEVAQPGAQPQLMVTGVNP